MKSIDREGLLLSTQVGIINLVDTPANLQIRLQGLQLIKGEVSLALWRDIATPLRQVRTALRAEIKEHEHI